MPEPSRQAEQGFWVVEEVLRTGCNKGTLDACVR